MHGKGQIYNYQSTVAVHLFSFVPLVPVLVFVLVLLHVPIWLPSSSQRLDHECCASFGGAPWYSTDRWTACDIQCNGRDTLWYGRRWCECEELLPIWSKHWIQEDKGYTCAEPHLVSRFRQAHLLPSHQGTGWRRSWVANHPIAWRKVLFASCNWLLDR